MKSVAMCMMVIGASQLHAVNIIEGGFEPHVPTLLHLSDAAKDVRIPLACNSAPTSWDTPKGTPQLTIVL